MLSSLMTDSQFGFMVGVVLASALLGGVVVVYKGQYDRLMRRYAHSTNDNDFLQAELMMVASRADPQLLAAMKQSHDYLLLRKQYVFNKGYIDKNGRRP